MKGTTRDLNHRHPTRPTRMQSTNRSTPYSTHRGIFSDHTCPQLTTPWPQFLLPGAPHVPGLAASLTNDQWAVFVCERQGVTANSHHLDVHRGLTAREIAELGICACHDVIRVNCKQLPVVGRLCFKHHLVLLTFIQHPRWSLVDRSTFSTVNEQPWERRMRQGIPKQTLEPKSSIAQTSKQDTAELTHRVDIEWTESGHWGSKLGPRLSSCVH
ncbi:hypothetical protein EGW08_000726 [Elysia chlorotica]|uniref:Uncharacterized protein n=1 Tax=Elysia chlorotica TaxID=188477 RepID=A0A3S1BTW4_ELYCH|nr:hypothetical protein EGW08_000726 [Elysia chlorotica]